MKKRIEELTLLNALQQRNAKLLLALSRDLPVCDRNSSYPIPNSQVVSFYRGMLLRRCCMFAQSLHPKIVRVSSYVRFRLGRLEHVCQHWRSAPSV